MVDPSKIPLKIAGLGDLNRGLRPTEGYKEGLTAGLYQVYYFKFDGPIENTQEHFGFMDCLKNTISQFFF